MKPKLYLKLKDNKTTSLNTPITRTPLITESETLPIMNKFSPVQDRTKVTFNHKFKQIYSKSNSKALVDVTSAILEVSGWPSYIFCKSIGLIVISAFPITKVSVLEPL